MTRGEREVMADNWSITHQDPTERLLRGHWVAGYQVYFETSEGNSGVLFVPSGDGYADRVRDAVESEAERLRAAGSL